MKRPTTHVDHQIGSLIAEVQRISQPKNAVPKSPSGSGVPLGGSSNGEDYGEQGELDRTNPPPWFDPKERNELENFPEDAVPIISDPVTVPDTTSSDDHDVSVSGTEALAFYAPFHFYGPRFWGIYVRDKGLVSLACKYKGSRQLTPSDSWILRSAYYFLLEHEYFHFQTEVAASRFEFVSSVSSAYADFFHDRYGSWMEEGIANANAYRNLQHHEDGQLDFTRLESFKGFAASWMKKNQPSGYRDFDRWSKSDHYFGKGMRAMTARLIGLSAAHNPTLQNVDPYCLEFYKRSTYSRVPIVRVHDSSVPWLQAAKMFPKANGLQVFVYTKDHKPVHIHVEFPGSGKTTKLSWPDLDPIRGEPHLSGKEKSDLITYMKKYHDDIHAKLCVAYSDMKLPTVEAISP